MTLTSKNTTTAVTAYRGDLAEGFRAFLLSEFGLATTGEIKEDGQFHGLRTDQDKAGSAPLRYCVHLDDPPNVYYLDNKRGFSGTWFPEGQAPLDPVEREKRRREMEAKRAERDQETTERHTKAAQKARALWRQSLPASPLHPYLERKGVGVHGVRCLPVWQRRIYGDGGAFEPVTVENVLLVPMRDISGTLWNVQAIFPLACPALGRDKDFLPSGRKKGLFHWIGQRTETLCLAEGYATAASIHEATGYRVFVCFDAGNLPDVAAIVRQTWPEARLIICGDKDSPDKTGRQAGQEKAKEAAARAGGFVALPDFAGLNATGEDTDFNDLHRLAGLDEVRRQIGAATDQKEETEKQGEASKKPPKIDFDTPIDDFPHVTETGRKRATIANLRHLFKSYGIEASYDELLKKQAIRFNNANDRGHGDLIDNAGVAHIRSLMALNGMPASSLDLLPALFAEKATNPVLDWIESKPWDGKDRLRALADTLTVADADKHYRDVALFTWLIQCVAAADGARRTPNKDALPKYELAFVLQGGQGVKKTSWFKRLVPKQLGAYIVDGAHLDPADKETVRTCISSWICELGELDSTFRRADISRLKAFLSKQTDTLRLPYDRAESQFKRHTSFCGSVNPEQFLGDSTGSRRFLPLQVTACNSLHTIDMQQAWAQAWKLYTEGRQWWCNAELEEMLKERHERHMETAPIDELIAETFCVEKVEKSFSHKHYTATRILIECGIKEPKASQASIANAYLKRLGFRQVQAEGVRGYWLERRRFQP
jgi:putative DNA primase/helicase